MRRCKRLRRPSPSSPWARGAAERRRSNAAGLGWRSRPQTVLETVDHLCHRKPSGAQGGAQATNKRLRPPRRGNRDGGGRRPPCAAGLCAGLRRRDGAGPPPRGPGAPGTVRRRSGRGWEPPWGRRPAPSLRPPPLVRTGGRAAKVGPGANQHLPTCRVGSCPGVPGPFPRRPRPPGHLLPVGGEPGCYLNARGS